MNAIISLDLSQLDEETQNWLLLESARRGISVSDYIILLCTESSPENTEIKEKIKCLILKTTPSNLPDEEHSSPP